MNLHAAAAYARHLLTARSTAGHGVHSPFMFRFITEVIGGRSDRAIIKEIEGLRREMLADRRVITVRDMGSGSRVMHGEASREIPGEASGVKNGGAFREMNGVSSRVANEGATLNRHDGFPAGAEESLGQTVIMRRVRRSVRQIAAAAAVPKKEAAMLSRIAGSLDSIMGEERRSGRKPGTEASGSQSSEMGFDTEQIHSPKAETGKGSMADFNPDPADRPVILELGTSLGISTLALALGAPRRRIITIEGCPELAAIARDNCLRHGVHNAEVVSMEFNEALALLRDRGTRVALAFIDGNHRGMALAEYVHIIREMGDEVIIVADDIHMNKDMIHAWESLTEEDLAPASLETFRAGMLFCLRNLTPGRYRLK